MAVHKWQRDRTDQGPADGGGLGRYTPRIARASPEYVTSRIGSAPR